MGIGAILLLYYILVYCKLAKLGEMRSVVSASQGLEICINLFYPLSVLFALLENNWSIVICLRLTTSNEMTSCQSRECHDYAHIYWYSMLETVD